MASDSASLVISTFNIRLGLQQGLSALADAMSRHPDPDILAIQEVGDRWTMGPEGDSTAGLAELFDLPHYEFVPTIEEPRDEGPTVRYGHALLSRWPLEQRQIIDLPQRTDEPRRLWHGFIDTPDVRIELLSTHLSHLPTDRPDQGKFLLEWLDNHPSEADARFLTGDLNAPPSETWMETFLEGWTDADAADQRPTFPADDPQRRIDYVLGEDARLVSTDVPPLEDVSDHRPVISRWEIDPR